MAERSTVLVAIAALLSPVLPVGAVYLWNTIQGAPTYQPLGITRAKLAAFEEDSASDTVFIRVEWGRGAPDGLDRAAFLARVQRAVAARTDDFAIEIADSEGPGIRFTFAVGGRVLGPYPPGAVATGIHDAIAVRNMLRFGRGE